MKEKPAALVIGAGIAGIQAALDIANAGFPVYLVEREPSIGGHMAQLDKTFPTLDCSACILTPRMVEVARNPNITLITLAEVASVEGEAGNFRVKIRRRPRYVDESKCTACGDCAKECPVLVPSEFDMEKGMRHATYIPFPQAVPNKYVIDKRGVAPCKDACPAHIDVQGYVTLIARGKFKEALALVYKTVPFPGVLGRVCPHPCEEACNRTKVDQAVSICLLKRFAADYARENGLWEEVLKIIRNNHIPPMETIPEGRSVGIVGAGPAGLSAAYFLALWGYKVTVYEALPVAGGMMVAGIPEYRLPREILQEEVERIKSLGVEIKLNTRVGPGGITLEELRQKHDAVLLAVGAHRGLRLNIPGEELEGVFPGVEFIRKVNLGEPVKIGKRVVVIGGGNVAIDASRLARRLGAEKVAILYRRSRAEMPASPWEVADAEEEGIEIQFLVAPIRILGENGRVTGVECIRMQLGEPDASGRRRPIPIEGSEFTVEADTVIPAIGQMVEGEGLGVEITRAGTIQFNPATMETNIPGVFAAGDAAIGPATVIEAIAQGKKAAIAIDLYLRGERVEIPEPSWHVVSLEEVKTQFRSFPLEQRASPKPRHKVQKSPPEVRIRGFEEVEQGFKEEEAMAEAERCLNCAICSLCMECVRACQAKAIDHSMQEQILDLEVGAIIVATGYDQFDARRKPELGYGRYPNVLSGLEFERLVSASGPTKGKIKVNGKEPKEVVFIKCVGSRDKTVGHPYCSRVCCMYTAKQAHLIREKIPDAKVTIFYMDVRAFGKGFEEFYDRVREEGVIYRRGMVSEIYRRGDKLVVRAEDTLLGRPVEVVADMVVLATGLEPRSDSDKLAEILGITRSEEGFFAEAQRELYPVESSRPGIFLAGCAQGPKDIPDAVAHAKAAAAAALVLLAKQMKQEVNS